MPVIVGPSTITINHNNRFVIAQLDASMAPGDDVGFFAQDTRFVSNYGSSSPATGMATASRSTPPD